MAEKNIGKITQIIGAVLDIKFQDTQQWRTFGSRSCTASWR